MKIRKCGYILLIMLMILFIFFVFDNKSSRKEKAKEIVLQAGEEKANAEPDTTENMELIKSRYMFLNNIWIYVDEEIPFVDEEIFDIIQTAYKGVDYYAEFEKGNLKVYEEYKRKFWYMLQNEFPFQDSGGEEKYISEWISQKGEVATADIKDCIYYLFDMNGDDLPELCINDCVETTVFAYNPDTNQYILWTRLGEMDMVGTKKVMWNPEFVDIICGFFQLDSNGNVELETLFWAEFFNGYGGRDDINMVMFPNYSDEEKGWDITDEMK